MELCTRNRADSAERLRRDNQTKRRTKEDQVHLSDVERFEYTLTPIIAADPKSNCSSAVVDNLTRCHTIDNKENLGGKKIHRKKGQNSNIRTQRQSQGNYGHHCHTYSMPLGFKQSRTELYDICHDAEPGH